MEGETPRETAHFRPDELKALASGKASGDLRRYAEEHVRRCPECERRLQEEQEKGRS